MLEYAEVPLKIPFINIVYPAYLAKWPTLNDGGEFNGPPVEVGCAVAHLHRLVKGILSQGY
jgi:hypothetical protein